MTIPCPSGFSLQVLLPFKHKTNFSNQEDYAQFWILPVVDEENREVIDDVIYELNQLIYERPEIEQKSTPGPHYDSPINAIIDIRRALAYHDYPKRDRDTVYNVESVEHPYFASLGATERFTDELLAWSYDRQCQCDPENKPYYLDCLRELGNGRHSSDLQTKATIVMSTGENSLSDIKSAYKFFKLKRNDIPSDDHIINVYKSQIDSAPRQKDDARNLLLIIAKDRQSLAIETVANDRTMTFEEALEFLNVTSNTESDSIEAAAIAMVCVVLDPHYLKIHD